MYQYPYGNAQQLNLDWLMEQWQEVKQSIDGSLQSEIDRVEAAITDLLAARDAAVAAAGAANTSAGAAAQSAQAAAADAATATAQAAAANTARSNAAQAANNAQQYAGNAQTQAAAAQNAAGQAAASANQAAADASDAHDDALAAADDALEAEGWAVGEQNGVPVSSDSPYYQNNAKYYAEQGGGGGGATEIKTIENVAIAHITDAAALDVKEIDVSMLLNQAGSGEASPSNPRPITPYTGCNMWAKAAYDASAVPDAVITFPVDAGTIYDGILKIYDDGTGKLITNYAYGICNGENNQFILPAASYIGATTTRGVKSAWLTGADTPQYNSICDLAVWGSTAEQNKQTYYINVNSGETSVRILNSETGITSDDTPATARTKLNNYLSLHPMVIVYKLLTPVEYTLTAQQVLTLLQGENYVWASAGNIAKLVYYAYANTDEKIALVKGIIAPVLDDMVADTALAVNDFRIVDNTLYKITAPIAAGAALTPNTNCTATTVGAVLKTLLT